MTPETKARLEAVKEALTLDVLWKARLAFNVACASDYSAARDAMLDVILDALAPVLAPEAQEPAPPTPAHVNRYLATVAQAVSLSLKQGEDRAFGERLLSLLAEVEKAHLTASGLDTLELQQEPAPPTCGTCRHWLPEDRAENIRAQCNRGVSGSTAEKASHHPYPITRRDFGCTLHESSLSPSREEPTT